MKDCIGILGWLFGHKFESFILTYEMPKGIRVDIAYETTLTACATKTYEIRCKRCGVEV